MLVLGGSSIVMVSMKRQLEQFGPFMVRKLGTMMVAAKMYCNPCRQDPGRRAPCQERQDSQKLQQARHAWEYIFRAFHCQNQADNRASRPSSARFPHLSSLRGCRRMGSRERRPGAVTGPASPDPGSGRRCTRPAPCRSRSQSGSGCRRTGVRWRLPPPLPRRSRRSVAEVNPPDGEDRFWRVSRV